MARRKRIGGGYHRLSGVVDENDDDAVNSPARLYLWTMSLVCIVVLLVVFWRYFNDGMNLQCASQVKSDLRCMATALESYYGDHLAYPPGVPMKNDIGDIGALRESGGENHLRPGNQLTTPVAYVTSLASDVFLNAGLKTYAYGVNNGWILLSPGPDRVYQIDPARDFDGASSASLERLKILKWDPTNGSISLGDIYQYHSPELGDGS